MDVLEYWHPVVDWTGFKQGAVSEAMWQYFYRVVQLCHAQVHWEKVAQGIRLKPPGPSIYPESKYQSKKRRDEWKREIAGAERHMHRAAFLASEEIAGMSYLLTKDDDNSADRRMYLALRIGVRHLLDHAHARFKVAAFNSFDADTELAGDPEDIARRWSQAAGYRDIVG